MNYVNQAEYNKLKTFLMVENQSVLEDSIPVKGDLSIKERIAKLSEDEKEKLKQYVEAIKEIKKEIYELINEPLQEEGGNMSSGLTLKSEADGIEFEERDMVELTDTLNAENQRFPNDREFDAGTTFEIIEIGDDYVVCRLVGETEYQFQIWAFDKQEFEDNTRLL